MLRVDVYIKFSKRNKGLSEEPILVTAFQSSTEILVHISTNKSFMSAVIAILIIKHTDNTSEGYNK
jgi:hypothetical protein